MYLLCEGYSFITSAGNNFHDQHRAISVTGCLNGWMKVFSYERDFPLRKKYPVLWAIFLVTVAVQMSFFWINDCMFPESFLATMTDI